MSKKEKRIESRTTIVNSTKIYDDVILKGRHTFINVYDEIIFWFRTINKKSHDFKDQFSKDQDIQLRNLFNKK